MDVQFTYLMFFLVLAVVREARSDEHTCSILIILELGWACDIAIGVALIRSSIHECNHKLIVNKASKVDGISAKRLERCESCALNRLFVRRGKREDKKSQANSTHTSINGGLEVE